MSEYYLMHSGRSKRDGAKIGSGRYPLGSGERPFQGEANAKQRHKLFGRHKKNRNQPEEPKKPLTDEEKQKIIESGDVRKAYNNREYLTNADIDAVVTRYNKEKSLRDLIPQKKKGIEYLDKYSGVLKSSANLITQAASAWNAVARINNTFNPDGQMKVIPEVKYFLPDKDKDKKKES